jgi:hypothetical protein
MSSYNPFLAQIDKRIEWLREEGYKMWIESDQIDPKIYNDLD